MMALGRSLARQISLPAVLELIGDVGTGKTTFTKGLAEGLGATEAVTSPSFMISKRYGLRRAVNDSGMSNQADGAQGEANGLGGELVHYDFYRLDDPGLMREELAEALAEDNNMVVVEWGGDVADLLPESKYQLKISLAEDGSRELDFNPALQRLVAKLGLSDLAEKNL